MNDRDQKNSQTKLTGAVSAATPRTGLRLIKTPVSSVIDEIKAGGIDSKAAAAAKAKNHPLVKQLANLADALDAEVAMILRM